MKKILYLNNDILSSYMSQIDDGLSKKTIETLEKKNESSKKVESGLNANGEIDIKLFGKGMTTDLDGKIGNERENKASNGLTHSTEKVMYDDAVDKLESYLESSNLLENVQKIGEFMKIKHEFFIIDLEYYKGIFSNDVILDSLIEQEVDKRMEGKVLELEAIENDNKRNYEFEKMRKGIKKDITLEYEGTKKIVDAILNIVPYNRFGIMDDYLIPLDSEYFREKSNVAAFKYGGEMTMIGYLTNVVNSNVNNHNENIFYTFPSIINTFMLSFFKKSEIKIVNPIAIYY